MDEKKLYDELQTLVKSLRDMNERAEEEKKKFGEELAATKAALEEIQGRIGKVEAAMQRPGAGKDADPEQGEGVKTKAAFLGYLRKGIIAPEARKALVEDTTGEILVPEEVESEIRRALPSLTVVRNLVTPRPTRSNRVRLRSITDTTAGWGKLETGTTITESTMTPAEEYAYVEDLYGLTKVGEDELMDADAALEQLIRDAFTDVVAEMEDSAFINGAGHASQQPQGVLTASGVAALAGSTTGAITADDMIALQFEVGARYRRSGVYLVGTKTMKALRLLKDSNGQYLWQPRLADGTPATFDGKPIYESDFMPEISGSSGQTDDVALFGDWKSGYMIRDRLGITIKRLDELYAEQGLVGFKLHYRVAGYPMRTAAFAKLQVTS